MKRKVGIAIIILTFLVSLNPYLLIFTIPAFLIGAILIWTSKINTYSKIAWTTIPIVLWYPAMHLFFYLSGTIGTATAQKLTLIFPADFRGTAVVIDEIECGEQVVIENDREILHVPENGILLYQGKIESGYVNHKYYLKESDGRLKEVSSLANHMFWDAASTKTSKSQVGVFLGGMGSTATLEPDSIEYSWISFTLSSKDSLDNYSDFGYSNGMPDRVVELIKDCKKKQTAHNNRIKQAPSCHLAIDNAGSEFCVLLVSGSEGRLLYSTDVGLKR